MRTSTVDRLSILPGVGTIIGVGTIASNTVKSIWDCVKMIFYRLRECVYHCKSLKDKTITAQKAFEANKAQLVEHVKFIGIGFLRAFPPIFGAGLLVLYHEYQLRHPKTTEWRNLVQKEMKLTDPEQLKKTYEQAIKIDKGKGADFYCLGRMYEKGLNGEKDEEKAKFAYEEAIKFNYPPAYYRLAFLYQEAETLNHDYTKALDLYRKGAALEEPNALNKLGNMYELGQFAGGVHLIKADLMMAKTYYEKAALQKQPNALMNLGSFYERGVHLTKDVKVTKDIPRAIKLYEEAGELGEPNAYKRLAIFYEQGAVVPKDLAKAKKYYELAGQGGNGSAYNMLGILYEDEEDFAKAAECFGRSAKLNNRDGIFNLGRLYEQGDGVAQDLEMAKKLYKIAADKGDSEAEDAYKELIRAERKKTKSA